MSMMTTPYYATTPITANNSATHDYARVLRRQLHQYPELSWCEYATTAILAKELQNADFEVMLGEKLWAEVPAPKTPTVSDAAKKAAFDAATERFAAKPEYAACLAKLADQPTGVMARKVLADTSSDKGLHVLFRFDIDALPITESVDTDHTPTREGFASRIPGHMHACGHDGHAAIGAALAKDITQGIAADIAQGEAFPNVASITLLFQPAEEVGGGAEALCHHAYVKAADRCYHLHLGITNTDEVICNADWLNAATFKAIFHGRAAHAGNNPEDGQNALLAACTAIQNLYALPRYSTGATRINVGEVHSDNAHNVIADKVRFEYELRSMDGASFASLKTRADTVMTTAAAMHGCTVETTALGEYRSHANSTEFAAHNHRLATEYGIAPLTAARTIMAAEDATFISEMVEGCGGQAAHWILGCPTKGGHHHPAFDIDERLLGWSVHFFNYLLRNIA